MCGIRDDGACHGAFEVGFAIGCRRSDRPSSFDVDVIAKGVRWNDRHVVRPKGQKR